MPLTLTDRTVRGLDTGGKAQADFWDTRVTGFGGPCVGRRAEDVGAAVSGAGSSASDEPRDVSKSGPG